jgi:hypothetical protein
LSIPFPEGPTGDIGLINSALAASSPESPVTFDTCAETLFSDYTLSDGIIDFGSEEWTSFFSSEGCFPGSA